jgi:hypothetical protein
MRTLALALFSDEALSDADARAMDEFALAGTYGTVERDVGDRVESFGGGLRGRVVYVWTRLFPPIDAVEDGYPFFARHRLLLPVLYVYRFGRAFTVNRRKVVAQVRALAHLDRDK